jgi:hypothetical protein
MSACNARARRQIRTLGVAGPTHERHAVRVTETPDVSGLLDEVVSLFKPLVLSVRPEDAHFVAEISRPNGTIAWPDFAMGSSELLAMLAAEQRFLVEQEGKGSEPGATYAEKAQNRLRRWLQRDER